jgi:hypothetical protein
LPWGEKVCYFETNGGERCYFERGEGVVILREGRERFYFERDKRALLF